MVQMKYLVVALLWSILLLSGPAHAFRVSHRSRRASTLYRYVPSALSAGVAESMETNLAASKEFVSKIVASKVEVEEIEQEEEETAFDKVASMGLAGVLAIATAETIFWALGVPLAMMYYKYTTGEWIDVMTTDGQLKAAGFSFGYGGFATVILQYRVTLFAIPLIPIMEKYAVKPLKKAFGESFGEKGDSTLGNDVTTTIIGATSGVGQCIANQLLLEGLEGGDISDSSTEKKVVRAVSRNVENAKKFELLNGCSFVQADARDKESLLEAISGSTNLIISVGTTAFPTKKWENGKNTPKIACFDSVKNILESVSEMKAMTRPKRIILLSSIGVSRVDQFPFKILNAYKVLDYKKASEDLLLEKCKGMDIECVVLRPGRLVGEPFTNFDLAKLLGISQGQAMRNIQLDKADVIAGDLERMDCASAAIKFMRSKLANPHTVVSVVNQEGPVASDDTWNELLADF